MTGQGNTEGRPRRTRKADHLRRERAEQAALYAAEQAAQRAERTFAGELAAVQARRCRENACKGASLARVAHATLVRSTGARLEVVTAEVSTLTATERHHYVVEAAPATREVLVSVTIVDRRRVAPATPAFRTVR